MFAEGIHPLHAPKSTFQSFVRGGGAFTLLLVHLVVGPVGYVILAVLHVLLLV